MTEATQQGAEEVQATPNPREAAMEQIAGNVEEQKKEEFTDLVPEGAEPEKEPEIEKEHEQAKEPEADAEKKAEPEKEPEPEERLITLKVDGKEIQVPESKIYEAGRRTLQKEVAADKRLEEATRLLREAESRTKQPSTTDVAQPQQYDAATLAQALSSGDPQLAALAVEELMKGGRQAIQPADIFNYVQQFTAQEIEARTAQEKFVTDYADIVQDPFLLQLAVNLEDQRLARVAAGVEPVIPLGEAFKTHGETIRKWKGTQAPNTLADKQERKATVQTLPSAKAKAPAPETTKPESVADIINDMRKARKQA